EAESVLISTLSAQSSELPTPGTDSTRVATSIARGQLQHTGPVPGQRYSSRERCPERQTAGRTVVQTVDRRAGQIVDRRVGQTAVECPGQTAVECPGQTAVECPGQTAVECPGRIAGRRSAI